MPEEVAAIRVPARTLDATYPREISKYLPNCARLRHDRDREWNVSLMFEQIMPIITAFETAFPR